MRRKRIMWNLRREMSGQSETSRKSGGGWRTKILPGVAAGLALAGGLTGAVSVAATSAPTALSPGTTPLPVPSGYSGAKVAMFNAEDQLRQQAAAGAPAPPPSTASDVELHAGILGLHDGGPFGPGQFVGTNLWNGPVNGEWLVVQAGGAPTVPPGSMPPGPDGAADAKAGVFVYSRSSDPYSTAAPVIHGVILPSNGPTGEFTVQSAQGDVLTLALSGSSATYTFNLQTLTFGG
jgi:hypothetical protein